jgi:hypothetical protein
MASSGSGFNSSPRVGGPPVNVAAPAPVTVIGSRPAPHSWITSPGAASPPRTAVTAAPIEGCPANGSSEFGVKMRAR